MITFPSLYFGGLSGAGNFQLDLSETDIMTRATFAELKSESDKKRLPYLIALVTDVAMSTYPFDGLSYYNYVKDKDSKDHRSWVHPITRKQIDIETYRLVFPGESIATSCREVGLPDLYRPLIESLEGDYKSQGNLGIMLYEEKEKNAFFWLNLAAKNPSCVDSDVFEFLGHCYRKGFGCEKNERLMIHCYKRSVMFDDSQYKANYLLGKFYEEGEFVRKNLKTAVTHYKKADNPYGGPKTRLALARIYQNKEFAERDLDKALKWIKLFFFEDLVIAKSEEIQEARQLKKAILVEKHQKQVELEDPAPKRRRLDD
jgi:TPR repeat protein